MSLYNYFKVLPSKEVDTPSRLVIVHFAFLFDGTHRVDIS